MIIPGASKLLRLAKEPLQELLVDKCGMEKSDAKILTNIGIVSISLLLIDWHNVPDNIQHLVESFTDAESAKDLICDAVNLVEPHTHISPFTHLGGIATPATFEIFIKG